MTSKKHFIMTIGMSILLSSCMSNCKSVVKPANPYLFPLVEPLKQEDSSSQETRPDPLQSSQWATAKLGLAEVWDNPRYAGARRVTVAILSTGVDYNHEDLRANILVNQKEAETIKPGQRVPDDADKDQNGYNADVVGYDFTEGHGFPYDRVGAGTAAAGIIGAVHNNGKGIRGVASNISLLPVKYIGANGLATIPDLIAALKYALAMKVDVIYLHLANLNYARARAKEKIDAGTMEKRGLTGILTRISAASIPIIASAGNSGLDLSSANKGVIQTLSSFQNVVLVTSVDSDDRRPFIANYGKEVVQTSAPGQDIVTTLPGNQYSKVSGTFAAAAYVTGAVALAISVHYGQKSTGQILAALLDPKGSDALSEDRQFETIGGNRLNIAKFLKSLE